jgi:hypothetical protein
MLFPKEGPDLAPQTPCPRGRGHTTTNRGNSVSDNRFPHELLLILAIKSLAGNAQPSLAITKVTPKCRLLRATTNSSIGPALSSARARPQSRHPLCAAKPRRLGPPLSWRAGAQPGRSGDGSQAFCARTHAPAHSASHQLIVVIAGSESGRHSIVEVRCNYGAAVEVAPNFFGAFETSLDLKCKIVVNGFSKVFCLTSVRFRPDGGTKLFAHSEWWCYTIIWFLD